MRILPLTLSHRLSGPIRCRYHQWRADQDHGRVQKDPLSLLEPELRLVRNPVHVYKR